MIPYFYIIKHIPSGKKYAGAKWGHKSDPKLFMALNGYQTSSKQIHKLILEDGLESFKILVLVTEDRIKCDVYSYETKFLRKYNIAHRKGWINSHNNHISCFGSDEFKLMMIKNYGVEYTGKSKILMEKAKETMIKRYGVAFPIQNEKIKEKIIETTRQRYGVDNVASNPEIYSKILKSRKINAESRGVGAYESVSKAMSGVTAMYYPSGTYYGKIPKDSPVVKELGLIHIRSKFQSETALRAAKLAQEANTGSTIYNNGIEERKFHSKPEDLQWKEGRLPRSEEHTKNQKSAVSAKIGGSKTYNDGIRNYRVQPGDYINPEWKLGMAPRKSKKK